MTKKGKTVIDTLTSSTTKEKNEEEATNDLEVGVLP